MLTTYLRFSALILLLGLTSTIFAQAGTTVTYEDNLGELTLTYNGQINGKASYLTSTDNITLQFQNDRWEIFCCNDPVNELLFFSDVNTANNPPDLATGNWQDADAGDGTTLIALNGSGTTATVLPVELTSFSGTPGEKSNKLSWATASETDNDRFVVERSANGQNFIAIGDVEGWGTTGSGNNEYQFNDDQPLFGHGFYRLRQIDFDGTFAFSEVISVENNAVGTEAFRVFPNPAPAGSLEVRYFATTDGETEISLVSVSGQVLTTTTFSVVRGWNTLPLVTDAVGKGLVMVRVANGEDSESQRVIIR